MSKIICFDISDIREQEYNELYSKASKKRQEKAEKLKLFQDKKRCIVADLLLQYILFKEKGIKKFTINHNRYGKPYIKNLKQFYYNISHSGELVVLAYGENNLGIDIEFLNSNKDKKSIYNISKRFFTENEHNYIFQNDLENEITDRFFEIWTGKESYLKYKGTGISKALNSFDVLELKEKGLSFQKIYSKYYLSIFSQDKITDIILLSYEELLKLLF